MIYFLYGADSYRSKKKLEEIIEGYKKVHKSGLNLIYVDAENASLKDALDNLRTSSMFAEKKLIVVKNAFDNSKFQEDFLENIKKLEELKDIIVIYEDGEVDERLKLFKELKKQALTGQVKCQEFEKLSPLMLKKWIEQEFVNNRANVSAGAVALLMNYVGGDLWRMANEITKLSSYKNKIDTEDVKLLVKPDIENDIFKTIDALASKDKKRALDLLHKHLDDGEKPLYLLSMIAFQFRNLLIVKKSLAAGQATKNTGLHPFVVQKASYLCRQFTEDQLKKIYQKIFQVDLDIKTGKIEPEIALDLLLSEI